jgi:hypothetical protein
MDIFKFSDNKHSLEQNLKGNLNITDLSLYCPILDNLNDNNDVENEDDEHLYIFKSKYFISELLENKSNTDKCQDSPYIKRVYDAKIKNNYNNKYYKKTVFIKVNPILDVICFVLDQYQIKTNGLPNYKVGETFNYINNFNNQAYIDAFFSFLASKLTESGKAPCFPLFYGTCSSLMNNYKFDITEDYSKIKYHNKFQYNLNKTFTLDEIDINSVSEYDSYSYSDSNSDSNSELSLELNDFKLDIQELEFDESKRPTNIEIDSNIEIDNLLNFTEIDDQHTFSEIIDDNNTFKYCVLNNFPTQLIFMEKLEFTLDDLIEKKDYTITDKEWKSILFQICFGLSVAQKSYAFVHNDLHSQNIMFISTKEEFLFYEYNSKYYKVPTFGKIVKIIDFGRATFEYNNDIYFSSVFDEGGDAEGQYDYPEDNNYNNCKIKPNPSFDLSRLASTIIEHFDNTTRNPVYKLLKSWLIDKYGNNLTTHEDNFNLYLKIAKNVTSAIPKKQLTKNIFKEFVIIKKKINSKHFVFKY